MTIIVFLVDNNFSMQQKTYLGISYLDVAKNFIESFIKLRAKEPNARIDRYMLLTLDEYPHNIKAGWRENHITFMHELKFVKANSLSTKVPNAVIQTFDLLNINRFMSGIDTFGQGRSPFYTEYCVCIFITNGCYLQKESNFTEKLINIFNLNSASKDRLLGTELWSLPYRWDHKFFTLYIAYSGNLSNTIMTKMVKSTLKDTTTKVIETHDLQSFCESTGAKLTKVRNPVEMSAFMDWILNYLTLSRITLRFKHPTILIQDVVDIPTPDMSTEYNLDFFASSDIDMRKTDFNTKTINNTTKINSENYSSLKGKEHFNNVLGSPVKTYETHITNIIVNAKTNCAQNSYWPLPESFYFHSWEKDILPVRDSIPTLFVNLGGLVKPASYQEAETNSTIYGYFAERDRLSPQRTANFPIDRYEIEPTSVFAKTLIEQYKLINDHLTCSTNNENSKDSLRFDCFQVEMHFTNPKFPNQNATKSEPILLDNNSNNNTTNALTTLNVPIGYVKVTPIYTILPTLENGEISNTLPPSSYICHLCIGPFNMFALIDIIDEILNVLKCKPTQSWYTRYEAYLNRIPLYYIPALRKALHKIGLQHVLAFPEHLTDGSGLSFPLISYLKKIKSQAKVEYDRQVALISHTLAQSNTGHKIKLENLAPQIIKAPKGCPLSSKLTKSLLAQNVDLGLTIPQSSEISSSTPLIVDMKENNSIGMALTTISLTLTTQSLETYKQIGVQIAKDTFAQFNSPSFLQTMGKAIQPNDTLEMQILLCPTITHAHRSSLGKRKNGMIFSPYSKCLKRRNNHTENAKRVYPSVINERKTAMYNTIQSLRHLLLVKDTWCRFNFNLPPFNERWVLDTKTFLKTVPPHQEFQVSIAQMGNFQEYQNIKAQQGQTSPSLRPVDPFSINNRGFGLSGPRLHTFGNPFKTVDKKSQVLIDEMIDDTNNEGWANSPSSPNNYNQTQKRSLLASPGMRSPGPLPANYVFIPFKDRIADSKLIFVKETFSTTVVKPIITTAYQTTPIIPQTKIDLNNENGTPLNKPVAFKDNSVLGGTDLLNNNQFTQVTDIEISTDNVFADDTTSENVESYPIPDSPDDDFDEMIHPLTLVIEEPKQHSTQISSPLNANIYNESLVNNKSITAESFENFSHFYSLLVYVTWPLLKPKWIKRSMKRELLEQTRHLNDSLDKKIEIKQFFHELPSLAQIQFSFSRFPLSHLFCDNNYQNIPSQTETQTNSYDIYQTASVKFYQECYVERAENIVNTDLPDKLKYLTLSNSLQTLDAFKTYNLPQYLNTFQRIELVNPFLALAFSRDHFLFLQHTLHAPEEILTFLTELVKTLCTTFIKDFFVE